VIHVCWAAAFLELTQVQNIKLLADWLEAESYETKYRPIPVDEHLVYEGQVYPAATTSELLNTASKLSAAESGPRSAAATPVRQIQPSKHRELRDSVLNAVVALANETARQGYGVLVFASSRWACESDAKIIARVMPQAHEVEAETANRRINLLAELRSLSTGLDPVLEQTIPAGVAFHRRFCEPSTLPTTIC
jgi:replicative superfamily II helicase